MPFCEGCQRGWTSCCCYSKLVPTCPFCQSHKRVSLKWNLPGLALCAGCHRYYSTEDNMICDRCGRDCVCTPAPSTSEYPRGPKPQKGQWIKLIRKFKSGLTETWEGPVSSVTWDDDPRILRSVQVGDLDYRRTFNLGTQESGMIEPGSWEIVIPAEPPNKSVWVCPETEDRGKLAVWRRLDHAARGGDARWFYPGSLNGATWEQVYNTGPGYLLEAKNG